MIERTVGCPACGGAGDQQAAWPGLLQCGRCGHGIADVDVDRLDFSKIYDEHYFNGAEYVDYLRDRATLQRHFEDRLQEIRSYCSGGRLVEIGCAYGFFLKVAGRYFEATGFDLATPAVSYARGQLGVDARNEAFTRRSCPPGTVDVIVLWDTVEHLPRPEAMLSAAAEALRPGGYLFLTTGDLGSWLARIRRQRWRLFHPPTHLHYFTRRSASRMLQRCGLDMLSWRYVGVRRSMRQIAYSLLQLNRSRRSRLYDRIGRSRIADLSVVLNTFDIMLVVARKPEPAGQPAAKAPAESL